MKIVRMACSVCEGEFYINESDSPTCCAICGDKDNFYATYVYIAHPTDEQVE